MNRHFPESVLISITYADGTTEQVSGGRLNKAYDEALAEYRAQNHLDAKGFSRSPAKKKTSMSFGLAWRAIRRTRTLIRRLPTNMHLFNWTIGERRV